MNISQSSSKTEILILLLAMENLDAFHNRDTYSFASSGYPILMVCLISFNDNNIAIFLSTFLTPHSIEKFGLKI